MENSTRHKYAPSNMINGILPIWLLIDEMAFGQIRMLIKYYKNRDKIYASMGLDLQNAFVQLSLLNKYRNQIFHGNELKAELYEKNGYRHKLLTFLKVLMKQNPNLKETILSEINLFISEIGISEIDIFSYLKISGLFK